MVSNVGSDLHPCDTVHPTGRHLNPIVENGGLNLHAYCGNDPTGHWEYLRQ